MTRIDTFDAAAEAADLDNDAAAVGHCPTYQHRAVTREQLIDAIYFGKPELMPCGVQLDPAKFQTINGAAK